MFSLTNMGINDVQDRTWITAIWLSWNHPWWRSTWTEGVPGLGCSYCHGCCYLLGLTGSYWMVFRSFGGTSIQLDNPTGAVPTGPKFSVCTSWWMQITTDVNYLFPINIPPWFYDIHIFSCLLRPTTLIWLIWLNPAGNILQLHHTTKSPNSNKQMFLGHQVRW